MIEIRRKDNNDNFLKSNFHQVKNICIYTAMALIIAPAWSCFSREITRGNCCPNPAPPFAAKGTELAMPKIKECDTMRIYSCAATPIKEYGIYCGGNHLVARTDNLLLWNLFIGDVSASQRIANIGYYLGYHWDATKARATYDRQKKLLLLQENFSQMRQKYIPGTSLKQSSF